MATQSRRKVGGTLERLRLDQLEPDRLNPRLPQNIQERALPPAELYEYMATAYDALAIAESIVRHGYFDSEPLVVIPRAGAYPDEKPKAANDKYVVVEGNRRLTALKALADPSLRAKLKGRRWAALLDTPADLPADVPALVVDNREQVAPILGFRHITGIAPWEPYPQASYIADLVDNRDRSFADVADLLNRSETEVKSFYRNYWIGEQARDYFEIPDAERIVDNFGVFTRAMQNPNIRAYIDAPEPSAVTAEYLPIPDSKKTSLGQLITWLFGKPRKGGDRDTKRPRPGQVVLDSRDVTRFGKVLADARGVAALKSGLELDEATEALHDPVQQALNTLRAAARGIASAVKELDKSAQAALKPTVAAIEKAIAALEKDAGSGS